MIKVGGTATGVEPLLEELGLEVHDRSLVELALIHPSAARGQGAKRSDCNQRLEFLGDRVLGLVIASHLYEAFPEEDEGALAKRFADLVKTESLAEVAEQIQLGRHMVLGEGEASNKGASNTANLADACEALIGALYLDGGLGLAETFIRQHWQPLITRQHKPPQDAKTSLQEWAQARGLGLPKYALVSRSGPDHSPEFEISVSIPGHGDAAASGRSKKEAERFAANALLARLENE